MHTPGLHTLSYCAHTLLARMRARAHMHAHTHARTHLPGPPHLYKCPPICPPACATAYRSTYTAASRDTHEIQPPARSLCLSSVRTNLPTNQPTPPTHPPIYPPTDLPANQPTNQPTIVCLQRVASCKCAGARARRCGREAGGAGQVQKQKGMTRPTMAPTVLPISTFSAAGPCPYLHAMCAEVCAFWS